MNALRTTFLLAALTAIFMAVGYMVGGTVGMAIAFVFALGTNVFAWWNSDKMVLRMQNAQPVSEQSAPKLHKLVAALSERAGLPTPAVYLIQTDQPNAFATGRDPNNAAVAVSAGLLESLNERELAGVIAHELAHIRNRDTLTMTMTATLAGAISMLAQFGFFFGGNDRNNPLGFVGVLATIILAPLAAVLVQMAVSRTREYQADREGAEIARDPLALASALDKISSLAQRRPNIFARRNPGMAHMFIVNPLTGRGMDNLFATHPDMRNRIAQLSDLARQMGAAQPVTAATDFTVSGSGQPAGPWAGARPRRDRQTANSRLGGRPPSAGGSLRDRGPWG